jgi:hypothetical protein
MQEWVRIGFDDQSAKKEEKHGPKLEVVNKENWTTCLRRKES